MCAWCSFAFYQLDDSWVSFFHKNLFLLVKLEFCLPSSRSFMRMICRVLLRQKTRAWPCFSRPAERWHGPWLCWRHTGMKNTQYSNVIKGEGGAKFIFNLLITLKFAKLLNTQDYLCAIIMHYFLTFQVNTVVTTQAIHLCYPMLWHLVITAHMIGERSGKSTLRLDPSQE